MLRVTAKGECYNGEGPHARACLPHRPGPHLLPFSLPRGPGRGRLVGLPFPLVLFFKAGCLLLVLGPAGLRLQGGCWGGGCWGAGPGRVERAAAGRLAVPTSLPVGSMCGPVAIVCASSRLRSVTLGCFSASSELQALLAFKTTVESILSPPSVSTILVSRPPDCLCRPSVCTVCLRRLSVSAWSSCSFFQAALSVLQSRGVALGGSGPAWAPPRSRCPPECLVPVVHWLPARHHHLTVLLPVSARK